MLCVNCYLGHRDGLAETFEGLPAAVTVYHGRALCKECLDQFMADDTEPQ